MLSKRIDELYDDLSLDVEYNVFEKSLLNLVENKLIFCSDETNRSYSVVNDVFWKDWIMKDSLSVQIMRQIAINIYAYFILLNTQKGKSYQMANVIDSYSPTEFKHVAFIYVDNDRTLAAQATNGFNKSNKIKTFLLSSNNRINIDTIKKYILRYDQGLEAQMPVILALSNPNQNSKVVHLIDFIINRVSTKNSLLRFSILFDEADRVYPAVRNKVVCIENLETEEKKEVTLLEQISHNFALHQIVFVTATEGDLLDEDYPEIYYAKFYNSDTKGADEFYSAMHTPDARIHVLGSKSYGKSKKKELVDNPHYNITYYESSDDTIIDCKGNKFAEHILENFYDHFDEPLTLSNGTTYFRKVIINSNIKKVEMLSIANHIINNYKWYALTFNDSGITLYRYEKEPIKFPKNKIPFNEMLFCIYKHYELQDKPLFIIGRKKVDRGLTFHYAPRDNMDRYITFKPENEDAFVHTDGKEGLIWTDLLLGSVNDPNTAVQKAGRCAGIIRHCPQYTNEITYWTDVQTTQMIISHNLLIEELNTPENLHKDESVSYKIFSTKKNLALSNSPLLLKNNYTDETLKHMRVPIIVTIEDFLMKEFLLLKTKPDKIKFLLNELKKSNSTMYEKLRLYNNVGQISVAGKSGGMKAKDKLINTTIKSVMDGKPLLTGNRRQDIGLNTWHCYIDKDECILCFNYSEYS